MEYVIPAKTWKSYYEALSKINAKAAEKMLEYAQENGVTVGKEFIDYAFALTTHYGEAAGELAAQMYDFCAEYWKKTDVEKIKKLRPAEPAQTATYSEVEKALRKIEKNSLNPNSYASAVGRMVKLAAEDTTLKNAMRDGAEFAWVPNGDTCPFCIMLASNGWKKASKKTIKGGHAGHIHANCDCSFAVRFSERGGVPGYEPGKYLKEYENESGGTWKEKLNSMRRERYEEEGDTIRAQKKAAYAERVRLRGEK